VAPLGKELRGADLGNRRRALGRGFGEA
jgi:hypothetical protein